MFLELHWMSTHEHALYKKLSDFLLRQLGRPHLFYGYLAGDEAVLWRRGFTAHLYHKSYWQLEITVGTRVTLLWGHGHW